MASCRHRWSLRDVRAPFSGLVVCMSCDAVVRFVLEPGAQESKLHMAVMCYGHHGLSLDDLESVLVWLGQQLQEGEVKETLRARPGRRKKRRRAA